MAKSVVQPTNLAELSVNYNLHPFAQRLDSLITETLEQFHQDQDRKGTKLGSRFVVWLVLALTIRRDLSCEAVLDWMISGWRWLSCCLPKRVVAAGAISHARMRVGVKVFQTLFNKVVATFKSLPTDFHGWVSVAFDGSNGSMPDTESNREQFGKAKSRRKGEASAYPQLRWMSLLAIGPRLLLDVAYGPSVGKGTGERRLMMSILERLQPSNLLFMMDAGLYSFLLLFTLEQQQCAFLLKVSSKPLLPVAKRLPDGSYLCYKQDKIEVPNGAIGKRKKWRKETLTLRVIPYQIPGFRAARLVTNILDPSITAKELVMHYHKRWDVELCFDEIKTHQCATPRGQMPTLFRSKRPELVEQELYAMMLVYNLLRELMVEAAPQADKDPLLLSFLDCLQLLIDAVPHMTRPMSPQALEQQQQYLLSLMAEADIDRPRRQRVNERVVKVKMSKFKRKTSQHRESSRDIDKELQILPPEAA